MLTENITRQHGTHKIASLPGSSVEKCKDSSWEKYEYAYGPYRHYTGTDSLMRTAMVIDGSGSEDYVYRLTVSPVYCQDITLFMPTFRIYYRRQYL